MEAEEGKINTVSKFQSPLPFILQLRDLIFGRRRPDLITKITFYTNLVLWTTFMLWSIISFYVISARNFIQTEKNIPVESIISNRGIELGLDGQSFVDKLSTLNLTAIILWSIVFVGLVLLFRRKKIFIYFFAGPILVYILLSMFYIGTSYFMKDTTTFDKIALLTMLASGFIYYFLMKDKDYDEELNFFAIEGDV